MQSTGGGRSVKSVEHAVSIVDVLQRSSPLTLSAIADEVDLSPGTVHTQLATLRDQGYVEKRDGGYALSPRFISIGERVRNQQPIYQAAKGAIQQLADETGEAAHLIREYRGRVLPVLEVFGARAIGVEYHAKKREQLIRHLHCTASGKAYLSQLPGSRVEEIIEEQGLIRKTPNTITDPEELFDELDEIDERGYAIANEEQMIGIRAVGAPVMRVDGSVAAAISVSGPTSRLKGDRLHEELPETVLKVVNMAEVKLNAEEGVT